MAEEDISVTSENSVYKTDVWSVFFSRTVGMFNFKFRVSAWRMKNRAQKFHRI